MISFHVALHLSLRDFFRVVIVAISDRDDQDAALFGYCSTN